MVDDARLRAPSTARNREPIFTVLQPLLPASGLVLEIASGAGEHICGLAELTNAEPAGGKLIFQPSAPDEAARRSIDAWRRAMALSNVCQALEIDAASDNWPVTHADVVMCINMIHISPWAATEGLFRGAARILPAGQILFTYGPYRRNGRHTSPGNESFDADLRRRNAAWGIRDIEALADLANEAGFEVPEIVDMPANNASLIFRKS